MQLTCAGNLGQFLSKEKTDALLNKLASGKKTESFLKLFALRVLSNIGLHRAYDVKVVNKCVTVLVSVNSVETEVKLSDIISVSLDHFPEYGYEPYMTFDVNMENSALVKLHVEHVEINEQFRKSPGTRCSVYPSNAFSLGSRYGFANLHTRSKVHVLTESGLDWALLTQYGTKHASGVALLDNYYYSQFKPYLSDDLVILGTHWTPSHNDSRSEQSTIFIYDEVIECRLVEFPDGAVLNSINSNAVTLLKSTHDSYVKCRHLEHDNTAKTNSEIYRSVLNTIEQIKNTEIVFDNLTVLMYSGFAQHTNHDFNSEGIEKITLNGVMTYHDVMDQYGKYKIVGYYQKAD